MTKKEFIEKAEAIIKKFVKRRDMMNMLPEFICELKTLIKQYRK